MRGHSGRSGRSGVPGGVAAQVLGLAVAFVCGAAGPAPGKINCNQVRLYIKTGRTVEDVAETMIIPVEEVKKCLEGKDASGQAGPTPEAKPGS